MQVLHLDGKTQLPVSVPGLLAVMGTEGLVHSLGARLLHRQVLPSIACTQRVEGH